MGFRADERQPLQILVNIRTPNAGSSAIVLYRSRRAPPQPRRQDVGCSCDSHNYPHIHRKPPPQKARCSHLSPLVRMNSAYSHVSDGHAIDRSAAGASSLESLAESSIASCVLHGVVNAADRSECTGQRGPSTTTISALCNTSRHKSSNCSSLSPSRERRRPLCSRGQRQRKTVSPESTPLCVQAPCWMTGMPLRYNADRQQHGRVIHDARCFLCDD